MNKNLKNLTKKLKINRKIAVVFLIIALITGYFAYKKISNKNAVTTVQTATVQKGTIVSSITTSGSIVSSNIENITTQASGTVNKVFVSDGDKVVKGQKLAEIELDVVGKQNYLSAYSGYVGAVNSLTSAKNSYRSTQSSLALVYDEIKGHDSDETLEMKDKRTKAEVANDNAYDSVRLAEIRLSASSLALATTKPLITAPVSGIIKSVTIAEGMNIGASETSSGSRANQRIATIETGGLPIATFNVSEIDVVNLKTAQLATITIDSITDKTFTGKVVSVDRVGGKSNNVTTYPAIIQFDLASDSILPNMAATANIILDTKTDILIIPTSAISYDNQTAIVMVEKDGQKRSQVVETGIADDTRTEIISGLSEGDVVVLGETSSTTNESTQGNTRSQGTFFVGGSGTGRAFIR